MDFEEVYSLYSKDVFKFCLSLCRNHAIADDITSETFLKAIRTGHKFNGKSSVRVWLCQIAKNTYYDYLRKHSKIADFSADVADTPSESNFELKLLDKAEALKIHKLLHQLDEPYKEVFSLRIFSELSFAEIGEIFEKTESWARVTFHRGKLKLKKEAESDG